MNGPAADMAWLGPAPWLPALAPLWPLALLAALALPPLRAPVLALARWAALPALLVAVAAPAAALPLPGLLLGGSMLLDAAGRWLLAAVGLLWLAAGWLAVDWLRTPSRAAAFLLAMAGALWLPLAGDLPSVLAASVLAAYPLYGLLGGARGGRVLLVSVVIADLLALEALLLLAKGGAGLELSALQAALAEAKASGVVLALLLLGFGAKAGVMGLHYWLAPAAEDAPSTQLAPTVAFTLAAGALPLLRLLPLADAHWPSAAALLAWLALGGCLWGLAAGLLQAAPRALTAYALSALATLWLGVLGLGLDRPAAGAASLPMDGVLPAALALSGVGIAALLLAGGAAARHGRLVGWLLALLAALLVALAVLGALWAAAAGGAVHPALMGALVCVGLLLGASLAAAAGGAGAPASGREHSVSAMLVAAGLLMPVLGLLTLPAATPAAGDWPPARLLGPGAALLGGLAVGPVARALLARLPRVPAGDALVLILALTARLLAAWSRLGALAGRWRNGLDAAGEQALHRLARLSAPEHAETRLRRWSTATLLLLLTGAVLALLVRSG